MQSKNISEWQICHSFAKMKNLFFSKVYIK